MDFDVVVIGSGFGGSVSAYKLAKAGFKVCILERGKEYPPGSFPRSPSHFRKNFWDPSLHLFGLFNIHLSKKLAALTASGLGGGSLIYSNVLMRKEKDSFFYTDHKHKCDKVWPISYQELEKHYTEVEKMIKVQYYPYQDKKFKLSKLESLKDAAKKNNYKWSPVPLAVTFQTSSRQKYLGASIKERGLHSEVMRVSCKLCGECNFGCNYGSKNTLDFNYLSEAVKLGAVIQTLSEVRELRPINNGKYEIIYNQFSLPKEGHHERATTHTKKIIVKNVFIAAGALNTPYLLLRNKKHFPLISSRLGDGFNGNGDLLAFNYGPNRPLGPNTGPVITSQVLVPGEKNYGIKIQDTAYPEFFNWLVEGARSHRWIYSFSSLFMKRFFGNITKNNKTNFSAEAAKFFGHRTEFPEVLPLCSMGKDPLSGKLVLSKKGKLDFEIDMENNQNYLEALRKCIRNIAKSWEAKTIDLSQLLPGKISTVHPLGGCPMGETIEEGVVAVNGEVFNYPGLFIVDGSVMPGSLGVNPALTIAATASKIADDFIKSQKN